MEIRNSTGSGAEFTSGDDSIDLSTPGGFLRRQSVLTRAVARWFLGGHTSEILDHIDPPHKIIDNCDLVLNLKSRGADPKSVQAFTTLNFQLCLGLDQIAKQSPLDPQQLESFSAYVSEGLTRIRRDLKCGVFSLESGILVPGLQPKDIDRIQPLGGLPPIECAADKVAYEFIMAGSNLGAKVQAARQNRRFGLTAEENGGAEFLNMHRSVFGSAAALLKTSKATEAFCEQGGDKERVKQTAYQFMQRLSQAFVGASEKCSWLKSA